jgi:hypothetical protein
MERPDFSRIGESEIPRHLATLRPEEFDRLLENPAFNSRHLVTLLRNPGLHAGILERVCENDELSSHYRVRAALVLHPGTPRARAMELLYHLFWRDLLQVTESPRVHPQIRRMAEHLLEETLESLTLGEKLSLARMAGRSAIRSLRKGNESAVAEVLLTNTRLTEEDVIFMASRGGSTSAILQIVGRNRRWSQRYPIRLALVRNPSTPANISLGLLTGLLARDLKALAMLPAVPAVVRATARKILEEGRKRS